MTASNNNAAFQAFVDNLRRVLTKNGFPERRVALSLEKLYASAYDKGLNFNKVLDHLATSGVMHEKTSERIVFGTATLMAGAHGDATDSAGAMPGGLDGMMAMAAEMLKKMSPEQIEALKAQVEAMSPAERDSLMAKARDLGVKP